MTHTANNPASIQWRDKTVQSWVEGTDVMLRQSGGSYSVWRSCRTVSEAHSEVEFLKEFLPSV